VGQSRKRIGKDGTARYTAYYGDIRGVRRSAGTYATRRAADHAWQWAEAKVAEGRAGDPARGRQTFRRYVEAEWLPNHAMEASTREGYTYSIYAHIMDTFGPLRMIDVLPIHVRDWITSLGAKHLSPSTIRLNKTILSAIFTTALNDQVTVLHPCKGVKTPPVPRRPLRIITPEEFERFHRCLRDAESRLLVETAIESGLRWGELTELRPRDLDIPNRLLTVSRAVVELTASHHPQGGRFIVKAYPKDREWRRLRLSGPIVTALEDHIRQRRLGPDDLLFAYTAPPDRSRQDATYEPSPTGLTQPNEHGRQYRPGTLSGYSAGRRRCSHCRRAYAIYRAQRRGSGHDNPREPRSWTTDGHIPRRWFREAIVKPALSRAGIDVDSRCRPSATPTPPGYSQAVPTCRSSRNDSDTEASPPLSATCTRCPTLTKQPSRRSTTCAIATHAFEQTCSSPASRSRHGRRQVAPLPLANTTAMSYRATPALGGLTWHQALEFAGSDGPPCSPKPRVPLQPRNPTPAGRRREASQPFDVFEHISRAQGALVPSSSRPDAKRGVRACVRGYVRGCGPGCV
jgi:integrase